MTLNRRQLLIFFGGAIAAAACGPLQKNSGGQGTKLGFQPLKAPLPLPTSGVAPEQQAKVFATYDLVDDVVLPEGFTYDVIASWGDRLGDSRVGYNNDYLALVETGPREGLLTVNFEYISAIPWTTAYEQVIGKKLPLAEVKAAIAASQKTAKPDAPPGINAFALPEGNPLKEQIKFICQEALTDLGLGVLSLKQDDQGRWQRNPADRDRRVTGISGLNDGRYLKTTGPAGAVFRKTQGQGYVDSLGDKVIGTFQNCAGGHTPWGTVFSAEENFQNLVPEPVYADGTSFAPQTRPFFQTDEELTGLGNVFGLAGNKYGWMVEIDPANPQDFGTKHTWLGRYRHEAVGIRAEAGKPLAAYSGCDRRGGHLYKFVSQAAVQDPKDKANSRLLQQGMLYAAQFQPDGTGRWIALKASTPIDPTPPTQLAGVMLPLPKRPEGGVFLADTDAAIAAFKQQFKTLGALYQGNELEQQGAILIDAHYAANAIGATCTARPEDTEIAPDGSVYIAFTSGGISKEDGSPDQRIFKGPDGSTAYEYGWVMQLQEDSNQPEAMTFRWQMIATGGEPASGGMGFANPDNLVFDPQGNLWMVTDMSSDKMNREVPANRREPGGKILSASNLRGIFGSNTMWCIPMSGSQAGVPALFGMGPMECEMTGPWFTSDHKTLFLSIQHPGEVHGIRQNMQLEPRQFALRTTTGQEFMQTRQVPIGSNWPTKQVNQPPKPSVIAIRHQNHQPFTTS